MTNGEPQDESYRPLSPLQFWKESDPRTRGIVLAAWLLTLAASIGLGIASIAFEWSGLPMHFGGVDVSITIYPTLIFCMLWVVWFGFWWGFIPAYLSTLALALYSGMPIGWAFVFAFSDPIGLAVFAITCRAIPVPLNLRSPNSSALFVFISFVSGMFGSSGAFIWVFAQGIAPSALLPIWQGWWLGAFLQNIVLVAPVLMLATTRVMRWRNKHDLMKQGTPHTQRQVLLMTAAILAGVLLYLYVAIRLVGGQIESALHSPDPAAFRDVARLQVESMHGVFWVISILIAFIAFFGYQLFILWVERKQAEYDLNLQKSGLEAMVEQRTHDLDDRNMKIAKALSLQQATLESTHDAILAVDLNNAWVLYNRRFIDLWHITDEIIAAGDDNAALAYVLDQLQDADGFLNRVRELYATPEASSFDIIKFKDGRIIERNSLPQFIDGKVAGRVWSFLDVTERKLAETELHQAKELAEASAHLKDQFVALVSHDLRSPLLSIKGMLDMAKAGGQDGLRETDKNRTLDRIAKSVEGLISLIECLLDHNRLQTGSIKPEMRFSNARSLVEGRIGRISHLAAVKNITIQNTLPDSMHLYADPDLYGEVIHNLLSNAIKFTRRGGEIAILPAGESTVIVRDNGVGIDEKMLPDLFNIGVKTTTYGTDDERGSGLGLPYSFGIMKAHGGSLTAVPIKGGGTEFHVTLPRHDTIVLIVDDQDIQRAIMKDMLAKLGSIQVVEARNGAEALEMLQHIMPAVIVTDIQMPVMDGFELVRQIRDLPQYEMVPIMAVTAFAGADPAELREKLLMLGADDFVAKPLTEEEFLPVVARYLGIA
ncbi:MAG: response regulator [Nitrosomonadales bacterium]|nr:response regulator [Nitrosomonadales bacterium]